jgi:hypothetical protein
LSFFLELPLSVEDFGVLCVIPALALVPGEDKAVCCFFFTIGSNMPSASAKLAPVKDKKCLLFPRYSKTAFHINNMRK